MQFRTKIMVLLLCLIGVSPSFAQNSNDASPLSDVILIQNAYIVESPGATPIFGSILMEKGLITSVGTVSKVPYNAQVLDADSMYIYAGFIDALSTTGIPKPEKKDRQRSKDPGNPSYEEAGIMPDIMASSSWSSNEGSIEAMRKAGITLSHISPEGKIMKGKSAIMSNGTGTPENSLIKDNVSLIADLKTSRGVYPSTTIAVISRWKELYKQAEYAQGYELQYEKSKVGMIKPDYDKTLQALYPVINKKQKVFFEAQDDKSIHRVLSLQKKLGFNVVLTEVQNGSDLISKIKAANAQVLLSMDLPKDESKKDNDDADGPKKEMDKSKEKDAIATDSTKVEAAKKAKKKEKIDPEIEALKLRQAETIKKYTSQAAMFEQANIPFAFSFLEAKSKDLHDNVRRMIEAGLSEKAALAALTTNAASILGVSDVAGTISKGKLANLVLTDKPYFDEKSKIKYVYIQGEQFEYKEKTKKDSKAEEGLDITGEWDFTIEMPMPDNTGTMKVEKVTDNNYTFVVTTAQDPTDPETVEDISLDGDKINFNFDFESEGASMNVAWDLTFEEESFEGTITVSQFGTFPITGTKKSGTPKN